jgi:hypothetical protein
VSSSKLSTNWTSRGGLPLRGPAAFLSDRRDPPQPRPKNAMHSSTPETVICRAHPEAVHCSLVSRRWAISAATSSRRSAVTPLSRYPRARETPNEARFVAPRRCGGEPGAEWFEGECQHRGPHLLTQALSPDRGSQERRRVHCSQPREVVALQSLVPHELTVPEDPETQCP